MTSSHGLFPRPGPAAFAAARTAALIVLCGTLRYHIAINASPAGASASSFQAPAVANLAELPAIRPSEDSLAAVPLWALRLVPHSGITHKLCLSPCEALTKN